CFVAASAGRDRRDGKRLQRRQLRVTGTGAAIDHDSALLQQFAEELGSEISRIIDGQSLPGAGVVLRNVSPDCELVRARLAIDVDLAWSCTLRRCEHPVFY